MLDRAQQYWSSTYAGWKLHIGGRLSLVALGSFVYATIEQRASSSMKQAVYEMQHRQDRVSAPEGSLAGLMKQKDQLAGLVSGKTNALFVISSAGPSEGRVGACKGRRACEEPEDLGTWKFGRNVAKASFY